MLPLNLISVTSELCSTVSEAKSIIKIRYSEVTTASDPWLSSTELALIHKGHLSLYDHSERW